MSAHHHAHGITAELVEVSGYAETAWRNGGTMASLETDRLTLREFKERDWQAVHAYASDPEVVRHVEWGPNTEEDTRAFIQRALAQQQEQPRSNYGFAVVLKKQDLLIGACGIRISNPDQREGWIGYVFNRRFWGQGYATEAARALVAFGFDQLDLHRIFATCDPANVASARVLEKTGMRCEGHLREHKWQKGRWRDSLLYAILDHEWECMKPGSTAWQHCLATMNDVMAFRQRCEGAETRGNNGPPLRFLTPPICNTLIF